ncbi:DUF4174 domain-containing protein [Microbulbifer sp. OS29]|uniref:DUF4174 domain-containing protein n=1 Tax=Microbulbifer okhotskensis TaxID=2926617 RepID=A0A9X2ERU3_9GAMM|nr:DUF4174 domain-containing protein [Microbulbifer okhotskensis]MCO1334413.1 DUF4174 domain-containing protein [Microbulbifer okhotskensis]
MRKLMVFILIFYTSTILAQSPPVNSLKDFQWKNRILLLNIPGDPRKTVEELMKLGPQFAERNLVWFVFSNGNIETNFPGTISDSFASGIPKQYFKGKKAEVALVGKDGEVKYRAPSFSANDIFSRIDSMPMRREEIKNTKPR